MKSFTSCRIQSDFSALATLASTSNLDLRRVIPVENISSPSIDLLKGVCQITDAQEEDNEDEVMVGPMEDNTNSNKDWRDEIKLYIRDGKVPEDRWVARRLIARSAHYIVNKGELYRWSTSRMLMRCIHGDDIWKVLNETHDGADRNHYGGRSLALKIKKLGFIWLTMISDCQKYAAKCKACQHHGPMKHVPTEYFSSATIEYPFMR